MDTGMNIQAESYGRDTNASSSILVGMTIVLIVAGLLLSCWLTLAPAVSVVVHGIKALY